MHETMRLTTGAALFVLAALLCLAPAARAADEKKPAAAAVRAPRIAVIDISRVYRSYAKAGEFQKKLEELGKTFSEKEQGLVARIRQLSDEAGALSMGSPRRQELRDEIAKKQDELTALRDDANRQLDEALRAGTLEVYEDTVKAVTEYAKAHEIDIVLKQQTFDPNQPSAREQSIRIGQGNVLYCAPEFDITNPIVEKLNADYAAQSKADAKSQTPNP